jgi:hypothetical protein
MGGRPISSAYPIHGPNRIENYITPDVVFAPQTASPTRQEFLAWGRYSLWSLSITVHPFLISDREGLISTGAA